MAQPPHPTELTGEQLLDGAKHLAFEAWMMVSALDLYEATAHTARIAVTDSVRENVALESCLTHARALLEFLGIRDRPKNTDMWPADFGADEPDLPAERLKTYRLRLRTIDQHLAHASWARVPDVIPAEDDEDDGTGPDNWPLPELVAMIVEDLADLVATMPDSMAKRHLRRGLRPAALDRPTGRTTGSYSTNGPPMMHIVRGADT